jgi:5-methylcytosine-specific restriction protein B
MSFISTNTIIDAYKELIKVDVKNSSIFHIFLILKGCGFNETTALPVDAIAEKGLSVGQKLSMLFNEIEQKPDKYEFINPFSMKEWAAQAPSETLKKWVSSRIKNNIIGGATTWRKIIREDIYNDKIKFANNYVEEIKTLTIPNEKIKLWPLTLWYFRFSEFESKFSPNDLMELFVNELQITDKEIGLLFDRSIGIDLNFSKEPVQMLEIRKLIGTPTNYNSEKYTNSISQVSEFPQQNYISKFIIMNTSKTISEDKIIKLLKENYQIILSGPPGTSKSFLADAISEKIASKSDNILKIQFHPQYSYQDFIGGFIVNGDKVEKNRGTLLKFLDKLKGSTESFVLIIDEINRANVGSVFGEIIQCLDRNYSLKTNIAGIEEDLQLPKNLYVISTMNTADRSLSSMDFALRRRFIDIYIAPNENQLIDLTSTELKISLADFLKKINLNLRTSLRNDELVIGQTVFFNQAFLKEGKFHWSNENLEDLFNYKILSMIEDFCSKEKSKIIEITGGKLHNRLNGSEFIEAISDYLS